MTPQTAAQPVKTTAITKPTETQQLVDHMERLYNSIARRAFEIFENNGRGYGRDLANWFEAESEILHPVHMQVSESDDALTVQAEVPGFEAKELDIQVQGDRLTISGKHEAREETKKGKTIYSECSANEVFRSITLPADVESSKVTATLKDGVVTIELPKAVPAKSVRVETKSAS
jgi:HSP20 family protein